VTDASTSLIPRASSWFEWHAHRITRGMRVLDLACGSGRHAVAAARLGATVTALDRDPARLDLARRAATDAHVRVDWREADLERDWPDVGVFEAVLLFNYLDRPRLPRVLDLVAPGGILLMETFRTAQRAEGWGPTRNEHLLLPGELRRLIAPLEVLHGREAIEPTADGRWRHVASICAARAR
jgi:2-polyprenyl-3-methyl-5-hydroxy-6-metoxy-1,4-benzoquinol methylase